MKIRNRHLVKFAGRAGSVAVRTLARSLRVAMHDLEMPLHPQALAANPAGPRLIYSVWHEYLLLPVARFGDGSTAVLISSHADGQLLGELVGAMGMGMVHGSTNRGGVDAVRKLIDPATSARHIAITPDGPRGPRRIVQPGMIFVASRTGMAIAPIGIGYHRAWRAGSWDKFAIPKPCSRAKIVTGRLIHVAPGLRSSALEGERLRVQIEMDRVNAIAEHWAATNVLNLDPAIAVAPASHRAAA